MNHDGELRLKTDRKLSAGYILKRNIKYIKPEIVNLIFSMILMVVSVVLGLLLPNIIKEIVNGLQAEGVINYYKILNYAIVYFLIGLISQATRFIQTMILQHAGQRIVYDMRTEVFTHIENMSQNQFNEMPVGSLVTRVASYTANMSDLFTNTIVNVLRNLITVVGVYVFMYSSTSLTGIVNFPPAAFSCPPPLKNSFAHLFADVPFFERIDILISFFSSLA